MTTPGMQPLKKIWMNGKLVPFAQAKVHVLTHALHYGSGLFEGMRCYATKKGPAIFRLHEHMSRLYRGAKVYGFNVPYTQKQLEQAVVKLIKINKTDRAYIRPLIYLGYKSVGISMKGAPVDVALIAVRFDQYFPASVQKAGLRCKVSTWSRQSHQALSPHVKATANYMNSILAKTEAEREGYDEAIMLTTRGRVSEGSGENLFIVRKGKLITPPSYDDILLGITRDSIIQIAKNMDIPVQEKSILRDELYTADEVFLTGTAAEVLHVQSIDKIKIGNGKIGPITKKLQEKYHSIIRAKELRYIRWLTFIK